MIKHILLDMDGVLAQFAESANRLFPQPLAEITEWDMCIQLGISEDEFWNRVEQEGEDFWTNLPEYPWAAGLVDALENFAPVTLASSPSRDPHSCSGKRKWMNSRFGHRFKKYMLGSDKWLMARPDRVLIDDNQENIRKFREHGGEGILFPQKWNDLSHISHNGDHISYVLQRLRLINERLSYNNHRPSTQGNGGTSREVPTVCRSVSGGTGNPQ